MRYVLIFCVTNPKKQIVVFHPIGSIRRKGEDARAAFCVRILLVASFLLAA